MVFASKVLVPASNRKVEGQVDTSVVVADFREELKGGESVWFKSVGAGWSEDSEDRRRGMACDS